VTNGVHTPTWDSAEADDLWTEACGQNRWRGTSENLEQDIRTISDDRLWQFRTDASKTFVRFVRDQLSRQLSVSGGSCAAVDDAKHMFDPGTLTLGFARRFATYKRPNLLLHDPERLLRILSNRQRPVQLIMAGKAHPADLAGQALIEQWTHFIRQTEARAQVIFLSDYDMHLTEHLVQGVDVWLNTPRRPWEACGTSGMKILVNGGINLSVLDGWWAEAYTPDLGWALGDGQEHGDDPEWDARDAEALYDLLENEVIPEFYSRDQKGIPKAWVARMRESMACLTPRFSADRAVREYTEKFYLPAALAYRSRAADKGATGMAILNWRKALEEHWGALRFGEFTSAIDGDQRVFDTQVYFGDLDPQAVRVELYADGVHGGAPEHVEMKYVRQLAGSLNAYAFSIGVPPVRPASDYTARVIPRHDDLAIPLENAHILWQR
jgi:starch phosphorylase